MNIESRELAQLKKESLSLEISDERLKIVAKINSDTYGIFGRCLSQDTSSIDSLTSEFLKEYPQNTIEHERGQHSIDVVISALQAIPECSVEQTPPWSSADIKWKWDLILKYREYNFPIQVKSSLKSIQKCRSMFQKTVQESTGRTRNEYRSKLDNLQNKLQHLTPKTSQYATILNQRRKIVKLYKEEVKASLEARFKHESKEPLYVWVSWDTDGVLNILSVFCSLFNVDITEDIQTSAISHYNQLRDASKQLHNARYSGGNITNTKLCVDDIDYNLFDFI
jgi:hypothetical protein